MFAVPLDATPDTLSVDYSYNQIPLVGWRLDWEDMKAWIALAVCLAALAAAVWCIRRQKAVFFFILFNNLLGKLS